MRFHGCEEEKQNYQKYERLEESLLIHYPSQYEYYCYYWYVVVVVVVVGVVVALVEGKRKLEFVYWE